MSTTIVQATTTQPTTTYDIATQTINISVIVSPGPDPENPDIVAAPCSVPRGDWTLFWNLQVEGGTATFENVSLPANPLPSGNVSVSGSALVNPSRWTAQIHNQVMDFNGFDYNIEVNWAQDSGSIIPAFHLVTKDPAIAVTSDPIG
jgi:hypothetical protein